MDIIGNFLEETVEHGDPTTHFVYRQDLYQAFTFWMRENAYRFTVTADSFGKKLTKKLGSQPREKRNGKYVWSGIKLTDSARII